MKLAMISLLVPDYDAGIRHYVDVMGFELLEDTRLSDSKRWVRVRPEGGDTSFLLARADGDTQQAAIGNQGGGRVWLFLQTDDFEKDHAMMVANGVIFEEQPRHEPYGTVAVLRDAFGNRWDLIQFKG